MKSDSLEHITVWHQAVELWLNGDWPALSRLSINGESVGDVVFQQTLMQVAGCLQAGELFSAENYIREIRDYGLGKQRLKEILLAGLHETLGRAQLLAGNETDANDHFCKSTVLLGAPGFDS